MDIIKILGNNSYPAIVKDITMAIRNVDCDTLQGREICNKMYTEMMESSSPILDIKEFVTGAEKFEGSDIKLVEVVDFCKKRILDGDLNFLINMCKEEHFKNLKRDNHPATKATIEDIKNEFNSPASVIEEGIKNGIFDRLQSDMLAELKQSLNIDIVQKSDVNYGGDNNNLIKYNPIGLIFQSKKLNREFVLCENALLEYDANYGSFQSINESEIINQIPIEHRSLMTVINEAAFNPENYSFMLNENWDFNLRLTQEGDVLLNENVMKSEDVKHLLLESINLYTSNPSKVENFNRDKYLADADRFIMLMENSDNLIKIDNIQVYRNLNSGKFVMLSESVFTDNSPEILSSSDSHISKQFDSYKSLNENCTNILGESTKFMFESSIISEVDEYKNKQVIIEELKTKQTELNEAIQKVDNLLSISDGGSPAHKKLSEQKEILMTSLNENLSELNSYINE